MRAFYIILYTVKKEANPQRRNKMYIIVVEYESITPALLKFEELDNANEEFNHLKNKENKKFKRITLFSNYYNELKTYRNKEVK